MAGIRFGPRYPAEGHTNPCPAGRCPRRGHRGKHSITIPLQSGLDMGREPESAWVREMDFAPAVDSQAPRPSTGRRPFLSADLVNRRLAVGSLNPAAGSPIPGGVSLSRAAGLLSRSSNRRGVAGSICSAAGAAPTLPSAARRRRCRKASTNRCPRLRTSASMAMAAEATLAADIPAADIRVAATLSAVIITDRFAVACWAHGYEPDEI